MDAYRARLERLIQCVIYPGTACLVAAPFVPDLDILFVGVGMFLVGIATSLILAKGLSYTITQERAPDA